MIHLFSQGQRKEFFRHWIENVPIEIFNEQVDAQKLEMELNIHFAVFYYRKSGNPKEVVKNQSKDGMNAFKNYIESKGQIISQLKGFLPYFGLPYADNPQQMFPEIFSVSKLCQFHSKIYFNSC